MSITKDKAIRKIMVDFEGMSELTLNQMRLLGKAIHDFGHIPITTESRKQFNKNERKLDAYEVKLNRQIIQAIVLYKPVASELRGLMACFRMITSLERIGDLVIKIVNVLLSLKDPGLLLARAEDMDQMLTVSTEMIAKAIFSFTNNTIEEAHWVIESDTLIDDLHHDIVQKAVLDEKFSGDLQRVIFSFIEMKNIISRIERIADHATHIAEASIYAHEGTDVRHSGLKKK